MSCIKIRAVPPSRTDSVTAMEALNVSAMRRSIAAVVGACRSPPSARVASTAAWPAGAVEVLEVPGRHHLSVLEALAEPGQSLHAAALALCAAPGA